MTRADRITGIRDIGIESRPAMKLSGRSSCGDNSQKAQSLFACVIRFMETQVVGNISSGVIEINGKRPILF
jgi:hypothetical protein